MAEFDTGEFSVYQEFENGMQECVRTRVDAENAVKAAKHYTESVGAQIGTTKRVFITDGDDYTCFEWKHGLGVTFK